MGFLAERIMKHGFDTSVTLRGTIQMFLAQVMARASIKLLKDDRIGWTEPAKPTENGKGMYVSGGGRTERIWTAVIRFETENVVFGVGSDHLKDFNKLKGLSADMSADDMVDQIVEVVLRHLTTIDRSLFRGKIGRE